MKTRNKLILKAGKMLLVICTLFSQLSFSLEVFADEVISSPSNGEAVDNLEDGSSEESLENENVVNSDENSTIEDNNNTKEENNTVEDNNDTNEENNTVEDNNDTNEENNTVEDNNDTKEEVELPIVSIEDGYIVTLGTLKDYLTSSSLKKALGEEYNDAIITNNGTDLQSDEIVSNNMKLIIADREYIISVIYDINNDGIVNELDVQLLETSGAVTDDVLNDITSALENGFWLTDKVDYGLSLSSSSATVGDIVKVNLYLYGLNDNFANKIEGLLDYDESLLELQSVEVLGNSENKFEVGQFVYLFDDYKSDDTSIVTFTFKTVATGDVKVSINNIKVFCNNAKFDLEGQDDSLSGYFSISPIGMGGDDNTTNSSNDNTNSNESVDSNEFTSTTNKQDSGSNKETVLTVNNVTTTDTYGSVVSLSSNNYISALEIDGYNIDFDMYTYEYNISVDNDIKSLDISVVLDSAYASYVINGNENFKEGSNKVEIVVTAEDGTERTYIINVEKKAKSTTKSSDKNEDDTEKSSNASKTVIIILIVLVIIGLIYVIFKDDEDEETVSNNTKKNSNNKKKD